MIKHKWVLSLAWPFPGWSRLELSEMYRGLSVQQLALPRVPAAVPVSSRAGVGCSECLFAFPPPPFSCKLCCPPVITVAGCVRGRASAQGWVGTGAGAGTGLWLQHCGPHACDTRSEGWAQEMGSIYL